MILIFEIKTKIIPRWFWFWNQNQTKFWLKPKSRHHCLCVMFLQKLSPNWEYIKAQLCSKIQLVVWKLSFFKFLSEKTMVKYTLHYFAARGRGECARLLLAYGGEDFVDKRYTQEEFKEAKKCKIFKISKFFVY